MTADVPVEVTVSFSLNPNRYRFESIAVRIVPPNAEHRWSRADLDRAARIGTESQEVNPVPGCDRAKAPVSVEQAAAEAATPGKRERDLMRDLAARAGEPATWIFQANSKFSDVSALRSLPEIVCLVRQFKKQIKLGDRVYLWECGRRRGIIALAEVLEAPRLRPEPPEQVDFIRDSEKFAGDQLRVKLRMLKRMKPVISRKYLLSRPELAGLSILRCSRGTNFRVTQEQAAVLQKVQEGFEAFFPSGNGSGEKRIVFAEG